MDTGKRLRSLREERGLSQEEVAKALGVSRVAYLKYESGENRPVRKLKELSRFFNVTIDYLLGNSKQKKEVTFPLSDTHRVPIIGTVRCGPGGLAYEHIDGYMMIDESFNPTEMRGFRAEGDSMIGDGIYDGDLCLIRLQPEVENGEIAVVVIDGEEGCLKHVTVNKENSVIVLSSSNPAYPQRIFTGPETNDICIVGKLIEVRHRF